MKTIATVSTFVLLAASPLYAADIYAPAPTGGYKDQVPPPVFYNWTGFYLGVNGGAGWDKFDSSFYDSGTIKRVPWDLTINHTNADIGAMGGGQIGYNYQIGAFLLGIESDLEYLGASQTRDLISASIGRNSIALGTRQEGGFLADVTGRLGYVSGPALFYAKGGWAFYDGTAGTVGINALNIRGVTDVARSGFEGFTIGGGIEYMWSPSWSVKAEYQYYDFGTFDLQPIRTVTTVPPIHDDLTINTFKVGLNYHFGGYTPIGSLK